MEASWILRFPEDSLGSSVEFKKDQVTAGVQSADGIRKTLTRIDFRISGQRIVNSWRPTLLFKHRQYFFLGFSLAGEISCKSGH